MNGSMARYEQYDAGARGYSVSIPTPPRWSGGGLGGLEPVVQNQPKTDYVYGYIPPLYVLSDGTPYSGKSHRMPNGQYMTGESHHTGSEPLIPKEITVRSIPVYSSSEGGFIGPLPHGGTYTPPPFEIPGGTVYGPPTPPWIRHGVPSEGGGFVGANPRYAPNVYVVPESEQESQTLGEMLGQSWRERHVYQIVDTIPPAVDYDGRTRDPVYTMEICRDTTGDGILDFCLGPADPIERDPGEKGYVFASLRYSF